MNTITMREALKSDDLVFVMKYLPIKDINSVRGGVSPLCCAMISKTLKVAQYLLDNGALVDL
jgi:hypothetical protein